MKTFITKGKIIKVYYYIYGPETKHFNIAIGIITYVITLELI